VQTISCLLLKQEATEDKKVQLALAKHSGNLAKIKFQGYPFFRPVYRTEIDKAP